MVIGEMKLVFMIKVSRSVHICELPSCGPKSSGDGLSSAICAVRSGHVLLISRGLTR
jgi:hypothetical protein